MNLAHPEPWNKHAPQTQVIVVPSSKYLQWNSWSEFESNLRPARRISPLFSPPMITVALWEVSAPIMRNTCWLTRIENTTRWESDRVCSWTCHLFQEASAVTAPRKHPGSKHCPCASTIRAALSDSVTGSLDGLPVIPGMMPLMNCWSLRLAFFLQRWSDF